MLRKTKTVCLSALCCMALVLVLFQASAKCYGFDIEIDISPNVLNIQSENTVFTVHTDIAYSIVVGETVFLNGVAIDWWKSDDRGNFVAKFVSDEVKIRVHKGFSLPAFNYLRTTGVLEWWSNGKTFFSSLSENRSLEKF